MENIFIKCLFVLERVCTQEWGEEQRERERRKRILSKPLTKCGAVRGLDPTTMRS